ncbi:MAG: ATP-binding protein [Candidatus Omnitrophica bacterium]|nr:ATP-binding protein [Candidatus Omnitrophota bacterium]
MNMFAFSGLLLGATSLILGVTILIYGKNKIHSTFALQNIAISIWGIGQGLAGLSKSPEDAYFWWSVAHVGGFFVATLLVHHLLLINNLKHKFILCIAYLLAILLPILFFTHLIGIKMVYLFNSFYFPQPVNMVYKIYGLAWIATAAYATYLIIRKYKVADEAEKISLRLYSAAYIFGLWGGGSYFLPVYGIKVYPYGNFFIPLYCIIIAYSIFRRQLFDIDVVVKKTLVFAGLFAVAVAMFILPILFIQEFMLSRMSFVGRILTLSISALLIILTLEPIKKILTNLTDRYLFQKKYNYRQAIEFFIDEVITLLDMDKIVDGTIDFLEKIFHPQYSDVLLANSNKYMSHSGKDENEARIIEKESPIAKYLKSAKGILSTENDNDKKIKEDIRNEMLSLKAALVIPLLLRDELIGIILLGKKKSDEYYTQEDLNILMDLARTLAIALKNAEFVKERDAMHLNMTQAKLKEELAIMAYGMSHQFNNKFHGIAMSIQCAREILQLKIPSGDKDNVANVFDIMTKTEKEAIGAGEIAQGLLNFSKPDRLKFEMVNITSNIDVVLQLVEYKHPGFKEMEIIKNIDKDLPLTFAHLGYLQEAYFIAIDNAYEAIEYMKAKTAGFRGRIIITASSNKKAKEIIVSIKDNGVGMKPEVLENVRKVIPYYSTKGSSGKSGHGAGNKMLNQFVDFHKGKVAYESVYGQGAVISIHIPIAEKPDDPSIKK